MITDLSEIKILRKKFELTQFELAKLSSVSQSLIAKIESNKIDPTYTNVKKIIDVLNSFYKKNVLLAKDFIKSEMIFAKPCELLVDIAKKMKKHNISQMPVIENKIVIGLVSEKTIIDYLFEGNINRHVKEIMCSIPNSLHT